MSRKSQHQKMAKISECRIAFHHYVKFLEHAQHCQMCAMVANEIMKILVSGIIEDVSRREEREREEGRERKRNRYEYRV